ncbi:MAG: MATE family efflux transporter [Kiritimatiellia bacterium]
MARGGLGRLLFKYSWPALVAMSLNALYSVVDRVFIGQGCGVDAMAGLQLAMPVMMFLVSFGPLIGVGHAAVLSIKLGEGDRATCEKLVGETVALKVFLYAVLIPLIYIFLEEILALCGADKVTPQAHAEARRYLMIVLTSHLFSHLAFGLSALQRAEGGAIQSMRCMVVGFGINLILDPILIFGFDFSLFGIHFALPAFGVAGAAWATNVAMFASCLWAFGYYWRGKTLVRLRIRRIWIYPKLLKRALSIGLAPFLQQLMGSIIIASLQIAFTRWMPDAASRTAEIASLGVFNGALILILMPILGCQQGLQPILGYNWGARNFRRVLAAFKLGFWTTTVLTTVAFVIQVVPPFPTWIAAMFVESDNSEIIALAAHDLQVSNCMIWCISINITATTYFQAIGRPWMAVSLSMLRQGIVMLPIIWLLPHLLDDKPFAIWLSMPVSDVICNLVTILPIALHLRFLARVRERRY